MKPYQLKMLENLTKEGISEVDALSVRRISMTLNTWFSYECGMENGHIERDEETGKPFFVSEYKGNVYRTAIADREKGALKRLSAIMSKYPKLSYYIQSDCRGASVYIIRQGDIPDGKTVDAYYPNGIAVYK